MILKKRTKLIIFLYIFIALFLFSVIMVIIENSQLIITGHNIAESSTVSNVTISSYLAIDMSTNLSDGIQFGDIDVLGVDNYNATHNNDSGSLGTSMNIEVSEDSNTAVDFCIKANDNLRTSGADVLILANESYSNATSTSPTVPLLANEVSLTTGYLDAGDAIAVGSTNYYRFWLDAPLAQATGVYNNSVSFKGVADGVGCS